VKTVAIVQARWGSTRLPGKVLLPLAGPTVLEHVVRRVRRARAVDGVVVATSIKPEDLKIAMFCAKKGISLYLGSEEDVLDRYYQAARLYGADIVVRITADCPLIDPGIIGRMIAEHRAGGSDYTSNTLAESFPDGEDVEVFTFAALERAWKEAALGSEREHVTPYIRNHPEIFRLKNVAHPDNLAHMRWTLDRLDDYLFLKKVYGALYRRNTLFGIKDILVYLKKHPEVGRINSHIERNEGYKTSLQLDKQAAS
jgi:spore coat polysaccharide biosynthesis protein SpsF (cytidylyltransferase family)